MKLDHFIVFAALQMVMICGWEAYAKPAPDDIMEPHEDIPVNRLERRSVTNKREIMDYLIHYKYMGDTDDDLFAALMSFQQMANLTETGEMNAETMTMMNKPRCGVQDNMGMLNKMRRRRRYDAMTRWPEDEITWRVNSFTNDLRERDVVNTLEKALGLWAEHTKLTFTQVTNPNEPVDFNIEFKRGDHGDPGPNDGLIFDGRDGILAHAFFPSGSSEPGLAGDVHFDKDELFTLESREGTNLFQLALHEFGHSLGLGHSDNKDAVMAPFYDEYIPNYSLHPDDIDGITYLYGHRRRRPGEPMAPVPGNPDCPNGLDAIVATDAGIIFAFKGKLVWKLDEEDGIVRGYPQPIPDVFRGLPDNIDAGLFFRGSFHFFKGRHVFIFTISFRFVGQFRISQHWKGIPDDIDAVFKWSGNGKIYFIKGKHYYRFNTYHKKVDWGYPLSLSEWNLGFDRVDTVLQWDQSPTYFFTGNDYYRYNDKHDKPEDGYPRPVNQWWFGCGFSNLQRSGVADSVVPNVVLLTLVVFRTLTLLY